MSGDSAVAVRICVEPHDVDVTTSRFYVADAIAMGVAGEALDGDPEDGEGIVWYALGQLAQYVAAAKKRADWPDIYSDLMSASTIVITSAGFGRLTVRTSRPEAR
jgi:hypothetical protein